MDMDFQDMPPEAFIIVAEVIGNLWACNLPFNIQNALGNWLQLLGQIILTYNAQQQYFQGGPGRYYNPKYRDVNNPFCPSTPNSDESGNQELWKRNREDSFHQENSRRQANTAAPGTNSSSVGNSQPQANGSGRQESSFAQAGGPGQPDSSFTQAGGPGQPDSSFAQAGGPSQQDSSFAQASGQHAAAEPNHTGNNDTSAMLKEIQKTLTMLQKEIQAMRQE